MLTSKKEVERRRREAINDGICDIQRLIPGLKDKAGKGSVLRSAAEYIEDLQRQLGVSVSGSKMGGMGMNGMNMDNDRLEVCCHSLPRCIITPW
jgi:bHLH factor